jgi:hypothetical protein
MERTDRFASELGIHSFYGRFAFAQLTHLDLPFNEMSDLAARLDVERMNWDSTYAKDMATFLSILSTNGVPCKTWRELEAILEVYKQNWKSRFLTSLFCEATSKRGYYGRPLYYSELIGYRKNEEYHKGLLDIARENGLDEAFDWMHRRILLKLQRADVRNEMETDLGGANRCRVYPYLVFGSLGWASHTRFEKLGGIDSLLSSDIPEEAREDVYIMVICCFSSILRLSKLYRDRAFSNAHKLGIRTLVHFGADTSIAVSPLFAFLHSEIGHIAGHAMAGRKLSGPIDELMDRIMMSMHTTFGQSAVDEEELDYSNLWADAPPDMIRCVDADLQELPIRRSREKYRVSKEWLRKLREE